MKKFNWILAFVLNFVTCGIYTLYLWIVMTKNSNKMAEAKGIKKIVGFIPVIFLTIITFGIFSIIWLYLFQKQQVAIAKAYGVQTAPTESPFLLFILMIVPIYSFYVLCDNYNRNVDAASAAPAAEATATEQNA